MAPFLHYWLPEIGTEVLVGFIHGNMNMPVVLGCLWNGKDQLPEGAATEKNETKTVMTKGGNKVTFTETEGKQKITVETPKGLTVLMDDENEAIFVQDKEKENSIHLDCKNGAMTPIRYSTLIMPLCCSSQISFTMAFKSPGAVISGYVLSFFLSLSSSS